jgi:DNA-binding transcriptional regulator/RsmH inhibitor MraZ
VFFFLNFLVYVNFTIVARKWPQYVKHWERAEQKLLELHVMQQQDQQVQRKIWKVAIVIMVLALSKFPYK